MLESIMCTSEEAWNGLIREIANTINEDQLEELRFRSIWSVIGKIHWWPLSLIEKECAHLKVLELHDFGHRHT